MLVLTRKANQQIQIGDNIVLTILQIKGNTVRVGIEAPREVRVIRGELKGLDADRVVDAASAEVVPAQVSNTPSSLRQSPLALGKRRDQHPLRLQPGMAAAAVADFSPIRSSARLGNGKFRSLALPRR